MITFIAQHDSWLVVGMFVLFFVAAVLHRFGGKRFEFLKYRCMVVSALVLVALHAALLVTVQYQVWQQGGAETQALLNLPLPTETPLPAFVEPFRSVLFGHAHGYFAFYALMRLVIPLFAGAFLGWLFAGVLAIIVHFMRKKLIPGDISLIILFSSIMGFGTIGFMKAVAFLGLGILFSAIFALWAHYKKTEPHAIQYAWLAAAPAAFIFGAPLFAIAYRFCTSFTA